MSVRKGRESQENTPLRQLPCVRKGRELQENHPQIKFAGADTEGRGDSVFQKQATIVSLHLNTGQIFSTHRPDLDDHLFWVCRVVWPRGATPISRSERNMLTCHVR